MRAEPKGFLIFALVTALLASGCLGPDGDVDTGDPPVDDPAPPVTEPVLLKHESMLEVAIATPVLSLNNGAEGTYAIPLPGGSARTNVTGYVLELVWEPMAPNADQLDLWIRAAGAGTIPPEDPTQPIPEEPSHRVTGASPLRLEVPIEEIPDDREYEIIVRAPGPAGVVTQQPFTLDVATFQDLAFHADHVFA